MHRTKEILYVRFYSNNKIQKPLPNNSCDYIKALTNIRLFPFHFHFPLFNNVSTKHYETFEVETMMYFQHTPCNKINNLPIKLIKVQNYHSSNRELKVFEIIPLLWMPHSISVAPKILQI